MEYGTELKRKAVFPYFNVPLTDQDQAETDLSKPQGTIIKVIQKKIYIHFPRSYSSKAETTIKKSEVKRNSTS